MKTNRFLSKWVLFTIILLLASFLRLYKLDQVPPGVNRDEASIGFTAYSLIQTGKDEYGRPSPVSFQSFGDWKLPLYIYTTVPFVKTLGLTEIAVRLPSAIAGIAAVGLTFFLAESFFSSELLSFVSMLMLAISPWHIHLSRVESESNVAVLFIIIALLFFFKALKKKPIFLIGSAFFFGLTYFTYAGNHVTTTLLVIGLLCIYRSKIPKSKYVVVSAVLFLLLSGFILFHTLQQADKTKLSGISIFGNPAVVHEKIEIPRNQHPDPQSYFVRFAHNRLLFAIEAIGQNYLKSFSPEFLFITGGTNHAHNIQNFGNLYLVDSIFFYAGVVLLFLGRKEKSWLFLLWWLAISPMAAIITKDAPHTNRMFAIYPIPPMLIALGLHNTIRIFDKKNVKIFAITLIAIAYIVNISIYLDRYYAHFPKNEEFYWGNGYARLYKLLSSQKFANKQIIISHPEYSPYIFYLFYSKTDPKDYQQTAIRYPPTEDGFVHVKQFNRFTFREIQWDKDLRLSHTVLVDFSQNIPKDVSLDSFQKEQILSPNGVSLFTLVTSR